MYFRRIFTSHAATGSAEKIIVEIINDDLTIKSFKAQASQIDGKTEQEINDALNLWMTANNYGAFIGEIGVHLNRDGSLCVWTGEPPIIWPEDL